MADQLGISCRLPPREKLSGRQAPFRAQKLLNGAHSDSKLLAWATLILPYRLPWLSSEYKEAIFDLIKVAPGSQKVAPGSYKIPMNWEPLLRKSGAHQFPTSYFFPWLYIYTRLSEWVWNWKTFIIRKMFMKFRDIKIWKFFKNFMTDKFSY